MHRYAFGPFTITSEIELPELPLSERESMPLHLRIGAVPDVLANATFQDLHCSVSASEFLLHIPGVADYAIRDGREITVLPHPHASPVDVRGFLLGNVFAIACHQRSLLPLHASAVLMNGGVVAFLGASGAGKSTLAAYLANAGFPLVADDICLMDPTAPVDARVLPVPPWLKLWRNSLSALGYAADGLDQTFTDEDKFKLPVSHFPAVQGGAYPLRALLVLERCDEGSATRLARLNPAHAIAAMMKFTYQAFLLEWLGLQGEHFAACAECLGTAPAYTCERVWSFASFPDVLASLQELLPPQRR